MKEWHNVGDPTPRQHGSATITNWEYGTCFGCRRTIIVITELTYPDGSRRTVSVSPIEIGCVICRTMHQLFPWRMEKRDRQAWRNN